MITKYIIYKITNNITGKIYIGSHKTNNINDGYMGSGKYLKNSILKHGIENFSKEILNIYDNPTDMFSKERELVNEEFINRHDTYNIKEGGLGGFDFINSSGINNKSNQCSKGGRSSVLSGGGFTGKNHTDEIKKYLSEVMKTKPPTFLGKTHRNETKNKISNAKKGKCSGEANSQYGTCWITNGEINKKIKKTELDKYIILGYNKGRT